jgi:hypothetical protein
MRVSRGWAFRRVGNPDPVLAANVRWLPGAQAADLGPPEIPAPGGTGADEGALAHVIPLGVFDAREEANTS